MSMAWYSRAMVTVTFWRTLLVLMLGVPSFDPARGAVLEVEFTPRIAGELVQPASLRYVNAAGERFSLTRLSYLLGGFALQRTDGSWFEVPTEVAWLDLERGRSALLLTNVPAASYVGLRFHVGLDAVQNHAD